MVAVVAGVVVATSEEWASSVWIHFSPQRYLSQYSIYNIVYHIAPLVRSVDLYDNICVIIAYISTFIVDYKSTIYVGNKSWRFIFSDFSYNIFPQILAIYFLEF